MSNIHRKLWEKHFRPIPKEENGRSYEIHHIDGNHKNNNINNLICITIKEHYDLHYKNGDYGACVLIAKRMELPVDYISNIQKGKKRSGIGGVKKGTTPWNKGISGYKVNISEEGKLKKLIANKKLKKLSEEILSEIKNLYNNKIEICDDRIGKVQRNGKIFTYDRAFCEYMSKKYNVTTQRINQLLKSFDV